MISFHHVSLRPVIIHVPGEFGALEERLQGRRRSGVAMCVREYCGCIELGNGTERVDSFRGKGQ